MRFHTVGLETWSLIKHGMISGMYLCVHCVEATRLLCSKLKVE